MKKAGKSKNGAQWIDQDFVETDRLIQRHKHEDKGQKKPPHPRHLPLFMLANYDHEQSGNSHEHRRVERADTMLGIERNLPQVLEQCLDAKQGDIRFPSKPENQDDCAQADQPLGHAHGIDIHGYTGHDAQYAQLGYRNR